MWKVMNVLGLKFFTNEAKKLATVAIGISKKVVKTCFKIQFNAAVFPFIFAYGGIVYVSKWFQNSDSENTPTVQPPSAFVCGKVKQLRNSFLSSMIAMNSHKVCRCHNEKKGKGNDQCECEKQSLNVEHGISKFGNFKRNATVAPIKMNEFSGKDLLWDVPIISSKAKSLAQCVKEERDDDIVAARKALQQHDIESPMPKTRRVFDDIKNKTENKHENSNSSIIKLDYAETRNADNCNANYCADSVSSKAKSLAQCVKEERDDIVVARKALQQHDLESPMPKTRRDFDDIKNKTENKHENLNSSIIKLDYAETRNADNCNANYCADSVSFKEKYRQRKVSCLHDASFLLSPRRKTKYLYNPLLTQDKMCLSTFNKTLGKFQTTCSKLLKEIYNLNEALTTIISMKEKLADLEFELDEGRKLLQEVEYDRSTMKSKLSALEKLINDEEKFLSSNFCESGFYESVETTGES